MANESKSHKSRLLRPLALLLAAGMLTLGFSGCKPGRTRPPPLPPTMKARPPPIRPLRTAPPILPPPPKERVMKSWERVTT